MNSTLLILLLSLSSFSENEVIPDHAIYVSVTEIQLYESKASTVSIKIFTDDLKAAIQNFSGKKNMEADAYFVSSNKEIITAYFNKHFLLRQNSNNIKLKFSDYSLEGDAYFINFNFSFTEVTKPLSIKAEYLMELFPTQQNVVKINFEKEQRFLKFDNSTDIQTVNFN